jgi:hypothetical protein
MSLASMVPTPLIANLNKIQGWVMTSFSPAVNRPLAFSSGILSHFKKHNAETQADELAAEEANEKLTGISQEMRDRMSGILPEFIFMEDTSGGSQDALFCLKKAGTGLWGVAEDYDTYVPLLVDRLKESGVKGLKIKGYFAEDDIMIGEKAKEYFDGCFAQQGGDVLEWEGVTVHGTDHDGICSEGILRNAEGELEIGPVGEFIQEVKKSGKTVPETSNLAN